LDDDCVAIVGLACRLPGARNAELFWSNLAAGRDCISRFDPAQLAAAGVRPELVRRPGYVAAHGVLDKADHFDWSFFGYSPAEAGRIDPQQRIFLECSASALDDAALDPARFPGLIGVFAGCDAAPFERDTTGDLTAILGAEKDFLATRVAYKLGLRGPALSIQTACSTSLVAVHQACQSLLGYECDVALAGGASIQFPQVSGYLYQEGGILARDGRCRPFDAAATGTVSSNGAGVVVLRRLADAIGDRHRIVAVIRGSAINNDGGQKIGFTAPALPGQRDVIAMALARASAEPDDIWYVEAHGTATQVGDPVEVAALTAAFRESTDAVGSCWLGGVKGNIGHTGAAAGVSGLIKTALMLQRRQLVPTAHFEHPNPAMELDSSPFRICGAHLPGPPDGPLLAGVSSFGLGGTNAHAVLESPPARPGSRSPEQAARLFCLSAASPAALEQAALDLAARLTPPARFSPAAVALDDVAWTLAVGRRRFPYRGTWVAAGPGELASALAAGPGAGAGAGAAVQVAFLFPGQGALRSGQGVASAYDLLPDFREAFDRADELARLGSGIDVAAMIRPGVQPEWFLDPANQQLALFVTGYALARQFGAWGVVPGAMLGNSIGEYVAAVIAGVWELPDALALVTERGRAMRAAPEGAMLAIDTDEGAAALIAKHGDLDVVVAVDSPGRVVAAGSAEAIEALRARLTGRPARLLSTRRAFHSPMMRPAAVRLREVLAGLDSREPVLPFISNRSGDWAAAGQATSAGYWAEHLCETVRLTDGMTALLSTPCQVFVELGPGATMTGALRRHPSWTHDRTAVAPLGGAGDQRGLLAALGQLWESGVDGACEPAAAIATARRCGLPPHPLNSLPCGTEVLAGQDRVPRAGQAGPAPVILVTAGDCDGSLLAGELAASGIAVGAVVSLDGPGEATFPARALAVAAASLAPAGSPAQARRHDLSERLDRYCTGLVARFVIEQAELKPGTRVGPQELSQRINPAGHLQRMAGVFADALTAHGLLITDGSQVNVAADADARVAALLRERGSLDALRGLRRLIEHCSASYPEVFSAAEDMASVLYPRGSDAFMNGCIADNDLIISDSVACLGALSAAIGEVCAAHRADRPFRILEVGAGSGELTRQLLAGLPGGKRVEYSFTDISPLRVRLAQERSADFAGAIMRFSAYDMTADPLEQGLTPGTFDAILAYNAVHVAPDVRAVLRNLRRLLTGNGWLGLVEVTRVALWDHLIWGLAPGWWDFDDGVRAGSPAMDEPQWQLALADSGFGDVAILPTGQDTDHAAILAATVRAPAGSAASHIRAELVRQSQALRPPVSEDAPGVAGPAGAAGSAGAWAKSDGGALTRTLAERWTQELGVAAARDGDDFFELGGDSLMVIRLLSRISDELGFAVPVAGFAAEPTFAGLVRLARSAGQAFPAPDVTAPDVTALAGTTWPSPDLLVFRAGGSRPPLFLAAPAAGTSLCYRELARLLDPDQPVYGIESPGLRPGQPRRIEDIAAHHVAVMREARPHGPYRLGGWSIGAIVAHEVARVLVGQGEDIDLIVCLDGYAPHTSGRAIGTLPGHLGTGLLYQAQALLGMGEIGVFTRDVPQVARLFNANIRAMFRYRPAPVPCRAILFKTGLTERMAQRLRTRMAPGYERGVEIRPCPGSHWAMLSQPYVGQLAEVMTAELRSLVKGDGLIDGAEVGA
jgi:acyl transferase domain-containing protein/thioesterase domain-containing protein/SAM-dependent methyltransferase/acyl carrier protein